MRKRGAMGWIIVLSMSCGGSESSEDDPPGNGDAEANGDDGDDGGDEEPYSPGTEATGWDGVDQGGEPNPSGRCPDKPGGVPMRLPLTGVEYCVKASPACSEAGADCPLFVTVNTEGAYFERVDSGVDGPLITVELYTETDGDEIKHKLAELPRVIALDYPGLDRERVYAIGWSAGAGAFSRGLCHQSKKSDHSEIGTTSDIYAAVASLGGCGCGNYVHLDGNFHAVSFNGIEDPFNGGDACESTLRERAVVNGCSDLDAQWQALAPDDPYAQNGDGSSNAERIHFGECELGEVVGYRGRDEDHVLSFKEHFDPKISGYDTVWRFLADKRKH